MKKLFTLVVVLFCFFYAQSQSVITGIVTDAVTGEAVEIVTVYVKETNIATETDINGVYELEIPADQQMIVAFTRIGYKEATVELNALKNGRGRIIDIALSPADVDVEVVVRERKLQDVGMVREEVEQMKLLPTTTGNLESVLPHIALGTSSGTGGELSSQYNVRGGNYDENLVYVNDFEIYRPQLIRAGQQEGLTFANVDLMRSLSFSSGGFEAKYGDKLSSVLDIKYKRPDSLRASIGLSALGGSAHIEGSLDVGKTAYQKLRYLVGARYKTTSYLLGSLDVKGEYLTDFSDIQAYITYDFNPNWQLGLLGNYNRSVYRFRPTERNTALGLINFALNLFSVFEGQEVDDFTTTMGGVSLTYIPDRSYNPFFLKFLASSFQGDENERFDILGYYSLRQIESSLGSDSFGDVVAELGSGTQHQYVRNSLQTSVSNFEHKGGIEIQLDDNSDADKSHFVQWSAKYQYELINDRINEWERLDSAGYSLPFTESEVLVNEVLKTTNELSSSRISAYVQDTYTVQEDSVREMKLTAGVRAAYWDLNKELIVSPRAQFLYKSLRSKKDISYRLAAGLYHQSPFYRELRNLEGVVNTDLLSQKSAHIVGGLTWDFNIGKNKDVPFRFIAEAYYKWLWDLVSYDIENVRIRYSGENDASGYAMGLDLRVNGEFVPGAESWINLSLLRTREKLDSIQHLQREIGIDEAIEVKDVARPTDQLMTLSVFFQDYLPRNDNFKMHLNFTVGTGLPYGLLGNNQVYRNTYRFNPYHRVDIGFSLQLWEAANRFEKPKHFLRFTQKTWLSLEIFNLMKVQNVASNTWIKTVFSQQYAIPNYLTSRRINLRLKMDF